MKTVRIKPGICGIITTATAESEDQMEVKVRVDSACEGVKNMFGQNENTFNVFEVCLKKPGQGELYELAGGFMPEHTSCPVIAGILKCIEVECRLALPADATIEFI